MTSWRFQQPTHLPPHNLTAQPLNRRMIRNTTPIKVTVVDDVWRIEPSCEFEISSLDDVICVMEVMESYAYAKLEVKTDPDSTQSVAEETTRLLLEFPKLFELVSRIEEFDMNDYVHRLHNLVIGRVQQTTTPFDWTTALVNLVRSNHHCVTHDVAVRLIRHIDFSAEKKPIYNGFLLYPRLPLSSVEQTFKLLTAAKHGEASLELMKEVLKQTGRGPHFERALDCGNPELIQCVLNMRFTLDRTRAALRPSV